MVSLNQDNEAWQKILRAAETEFAAKGFDGSRVDTIAVFFYVPVTGLVQALVTSLVRASAPSVDSLADFPA